MISSTHRQSHIFWFFVNFGRDFIEMRFVDQPDIPGAYQTSIPGCLERFVLLATYFIDGLIEVLARAFPIESDFLWLPESAVM